MKIWKAIYVASRGEKKVAERLFGEEVEVYLPLRKTIKQWSDRKKIIREPMLPGYIFVKIEPNESVRNKILNVQGVVMFVRDLGKDAVIPEREINTLKNIEKLGYDAEAYYKPLSAGDKVLIKQGALKNKQAEVLEVTKEGTVFAFLLEGINQCLKVKVPQEMVEVF